MLRRLYDWTMGLAAHRHALALLALVAFVESSIFPIPPDVLLVPLVLAARARAWRIALVCTIASVAGLPTEAPPDTRGGFVGRTRSAR